MYLVLSGEGDSSPISGRQVHPKRLLICTEVDGEFSSSDDVDLAQSLSNLTTNEEEEPSFLAVNMADGLRRRRRNRNK